MLDEALNKFLWEKVRESTIWNKAREAWAWEVGGIGVILLLSGVFKISSAELVNDSLKEIGLAFIVAAILIKTTEQASKQEMRIVFQGYMNILEDTMRDKLRMFSNLNDIREFITKLGESHFGSEETRKMAEKILQEYTGGLRFENECLEIEDRNWAMETMRHFYKVLQEPMCASNGIEVRVTHPGRIDLWSKNDAVNAAIDEQEKFIQKKGASIHRIFVGREAIPLQPSSQYRWIMDDMKKHQIHAYYVCAEEKDIYDTPDITWVPALNILMKWEKAMEILPEFE